MNKKTRNIIFIFSMIIIIISIFINIQTNSYITQTKHLNNVLVGSSYLNTLNQTIFLILLSLYGLIFGYCFSDILKIQHIVVLSPLLAASIWMITGKILLCTGIIYNAYTSVAAMLIVLLAVVLIKKPNFKPIFNMNTLVILSAYISLCLFLSSVDFTLFTEDTYTYIILGESLATNGSLLPSLSIEYSARSLVTSLLLTPSEFFGFDFENGLYTLYGFSFNVSVCYFIYEELIKKISKKKSIIVILFIFVMLMISGLYSTIILFYPMSNSIALISMFLAIFFIYKAKEDNEKLLFISMIFMICFNWARTESVIVSLILMFFMTNMDFKKRNVILYQIICLFAILTWYAKFFTVAGLNFNSGKFLTISRAKMIALAYIAFVVYTVFVSKFKFYNRIKRKLDYLPFIAMILAIIAYIPINGYKVIRNVGVIFANISIAGGWGVVILILLCVLSINYYYNDKYDIWDKSLLAYVIAIMFIFLFRSTSLRPGLGDSGNRIMAAAIPLAVYIVSTRLVPKLLYKKKEILSD